MLTEAAANEEALVITIPPPLTAACLYEPERVDWLARLPATIYALQHSLTSASGQRCDHAIREFVVWYIARRASSTVGTWSNFQSRPEHEFETDGGPTYSG